MHFLTKDGVKPSLEKKVIFNVDLMENLFNKYGYILQNAVLNRKWLKIV